MASCGILKLDLCANSGRSWLTYIKQIQLILPSLGRLPYRDCFVCHLDKHRGTY